MNDFIQHDFPEITGLRNQVLDAISDADLPYKLPGNNMTLGELIQEMGHFEQVYTQSFKTFKMEWGFQSTKPDAPITVASLRAWFKKLDAEMLEAIGALSE